MSEEIVCPECGEAHMKVRQGSTESYAVRCACCDEVLVWTQEDKQIMHPGLET